MNYILIDNTDSMFKVSWQILSNTYVQWRHLSNQYKTTTQKLPKLSIGGHLNSGPEILALNEQESSLYRTVLKSQAAQ